jgi:hypothetical protein
MKEKKLLKMQSLPKVLRSQAMRSTTYFEPKSKFPAKLAEACLPFFFLDVLINQPSHPEDLFRTEPHEGKGLHGAILML